jgi:hypothetical protein
MGFVMMRLTKQNEVIRGVIGVVLVNVMYLITFFPADCA